MAPLVFDKSKFNQFKPELVHIFMGSESKPIAFKGQNMAGVADLTGQPVTNKFLNAIGRIGREYNRRFETQNPEPVTPYSRGTGTLITHKHILTAKHVYDRNIKDNLGKIGIEFMATADYDGSDFYPISKAPPCFLKGLDAVILTLEETPPQDPMPVRSLPTPIGRDVQLIGYPHPIPFPSNVYKLWDDDLFDDVRVDLLMFGGKKSVFSLKRESTGQIFRPRKLPESEKNLFFEHDDLGRIPVFCFNASAESGSSGSPVLSIDNDFLGMYFMGNTRTFGEPANLAISVDSLLAAILCEDLNNLPDGQMNDRIESILTSGTNTP